MRNRSRFVFVNAPTISAITTIQHNDKNTKDVLPLGKNDDDNAGSKRRSEGKFDIGINLKIVYIYIIPIPNKFCTIKPRNSVYLAESIRDQDLVSIDRP